MEKLNILGTVVEIDDSLVEYNKIRKEFAAKATAASAGFRKAYEGYGNYEKFIERFREDVVSFFEGTVMYCTQVLVNHGILEIDDERFINDNQYVLNPLREAVETIADTFDAIDDAVNQNKAERGARKESRGRFVGGGFGVGAAVEASVKAGALNMATGAAHSIFNSIGNGFDRMRASSQKSNIYKGQDAVNKLCEGIYGSVFCCHFALIKYFAVFNIDRRPYEGMISSEAQKSAAVILNNADKINDFERCRIALIDSLIKDPYQEKWYKYVLARFGDEDGDLENTAEYFGCKELHNQKTILVVNFAKQLSLDTETKALDARATLDKFKIKLHYQDRVQIEDEIDNKIEYFDKLARTVDEILFNTREEANIAQKELIIIQNKLKVLDEQNIDDIMAVRAFITTLKCRELIEKYEKMLIEKAFDLFMKDHPLDTEEEALFARNEIILFKDKIHFDGKSEVEEDIEQAIKKFDKQARTVDEIIFSTREEAKIAEKEYSLLKEKSETIDEQKIEDLKEIYGFIEKLESKKLARKYKEKYKKKIDDLDFALEHHDEIKKAKLVRLLSICLLVTIVIISYFFPIATSSKLYRAKIELFGTPLLVQGHVFVREPNYIQGVINGIGVIGRSIGDVVVAGILEYVQGFLSRGIIGKMIWAFLGIVIVIIQQAIAAIPRMLVSIYKLMFQHATLGYHIGFVVGIALPIYCLVCATEDNIKSNIEKTAFISFKWIAKAIIAVTVISIISIFILDRI